MATGYTNDTYNRLLLTVSLSLVSSNAATNQSTVRVDINIQDGNASYGGTSLLDYSYSYTGLSTQSGTIQYDAGGYNNTGPFTGTYQLAGPGNITVTHNSVGVATATATATITGQGSPYGTVTVSESLTLTDFSRIPQAPAAPTITRTGTGTTITVASAVAADATGDPAPPAITNYKYRYSTNNSTWTEVTGMGTDRVQDFGPTSPITVSGTQVYYFQTAATNSEGYGPWSGSKAAYAAPTITSLTRAGLSVAVAVSPNASNGGATITSHVVQASSDLTTWTSQTISGASGGTTTFSSLSPGKTWYFRAYAVHATTPSATNSPTTANQSVFVSAYGKRYDATNAYVTVNTGKRYDANGGGAGVPGWVDIQTAKQYLSNEVTGAVGSGSVVTYTATGHPFNAGDVVSITGILPTAYRLTNVTIASIPNANSFTVNSTATGTYTSNGTVIGWSILS